MTLQFQVWSKTFLWTNLIGQIRTLQQTWPSEIGHFGHFKKLFRFARIVSLRCLMPTKVFREVIHSIAIWFMRFLLSLYCQAPKVADTGASQEWALSIKHIYAWGRSIAKLDCQYSCYALRLYVWYVRGHHGGNIEKRWNRRDVKKLIVLICYRYQVGYEVPVNVYGVTLRIIHDLMQSIPIACQ